MSAFRYEKLEIWQRSMTLWEELHTLTESFPKSETFSLTSQIRRAACSVPSNIAEGYGKGTNVSFAAMVRHSRGSIYELRTLIEGARRIGYVPDESAQGIQQELEELSRMIDAFLKSLETLEVKESVVAYGADEG